MASAEPSRAKSHRPSSPILPGLPVKVNEFGISI